MSTVNIIWARLMAQMIRNLPVMHETWVRSLGQKDPLEKGRATHSSILAWGIPWTEKPGALQSMRSQRVRHCWATALSQLITAPCPAPSGFIRPNSFSLCENPVRSTLSLTSTGSPSWIQSTTGQKILQENETSRKLPKAELEFAAQRHPRRSTDSAVGVTRNHEAAASAWERGFPGGPGGWEPAFQRRGLWFDPWSGN